MFLVTLISLIGIIIILFPFFLKRLIKKSGMDDLEFNYVHPIRYSKIKLVKKMELSYFKQLIIYINDFRIRILFINNDS
jgi:hypothetical protein